MIQIPWEWRNWLHSLFWDIRMPPWDIWVFSWLIAYAGSWLNIRISPGDIVLAALDMIVALINNSLTIISGTVYNLQQIVNWLRQQAQSVWDWANYIWSQLSNLASQIYSTVTQWIQTVYVYISQTITTVWTNVLEVTKGWTQDVYNWTTSQLAQLSAATQTALDTFSNWVGRQLDDIHRDFINRLQLIQDHIWSQLDPWLNTINALTTALNAITINPVGWFIGIIFDPIARDFGTGIEKGVLRGLQDSNETLETKDWGPQ